MKQSSEHYNFVGSIMNTPFLKKIIIMNMPRRKTSNAMDIESMTVVLTGK